MGHSPQNMPIEKEQLVADLRQLGIQTGDTILVHSSLKSLGPVNGSSITVIEALLEAISPEGTLLMPSFQAGAEFYLVDRGCRFEIKNTPSDCGVITETFRKMPGTIRSLNPTHCTAGYGPLARKLLSGHEKCRISVGCGSPYHRLAQRNSKILLLGVTHTVNTMLHLVENTNGAPTICRHEYQPVVVDVDGREMVVPMFPHMPGLPRNYQRVDPLLAAAGIQTIGRVGQAEARLIQTMPMVEMLGRKIRRSPLFLIEPCDFSEFNQ